MPRRVEPGDFDEVTWAASQARSKILARLAIKKGVSKSDMDAAAWELGVGRAQCYRLLRRYRQDPTVTSVAPRRRGRTVGAKLLAPAVEAVIEDAIDQFYLVPEAPTLAKLVREIERRCAAAALKPPAYNSVRARVRSKNARVVLRRRKGPAYARAKTGLIVGHLEADGPLSLVQIDHTQADVVVVAEGTRLPIKRPWLTLAIDVATRMVAGFYVSLDPPSALAVAMVMSRAVMSKEEYLKGRGVNVAWPASGIPDRIHVDNGKEFRSQALARGLAQYGIEVDFRPPAQPHWGGHIERLIGTMMGAVHLLPGSTSRNSVERGDYDSEASAVMTISELETWLVHQVAGVYHHTIHRGLGKAPITAWTEGIAARSSPVRHPRDEDRFFLDFLPAEKRLVQRSGITLFGISYSDGVLSTFLSRPQRIVLVRYDPRDLSRVYVRDSDGIYWPIPYSDRRLPSVTLSELKSAHKRLRESGHKHATQAQLFASMDDQRALVADAVVKTKAARREHERRRRALGEAKAERKLPVVSLDTPEDGEEAGPILPYSVEEWS